MNIRLPVIALLLVLTGGVRADIIPDGYKGVPNETLIEGTENYPDKKFVLAPVRFGYKDSHFAVKPGEDIRFYHMVSPNLYALDAGADLTDGSIFEDSSVPRSDVEIRQIGPVPQSETASFIRRIYRITGITGHHIALERQPDQRFDAGGKLMDAPPGAGAVKPGEEQSGSKAGMILGGAAFLGVTALWIRRLRAERKPGATA